MKIQLLADRILVKKLPVPENKSESGIILSDRQREYDDFEIVQVSNSVKQLKPGMKIRKFRNSEGVPITFNNETFMILREGSDIEFVL